MILETQVRLIGGTVAFEECCILDICESFNEKCNVNPIVLGALYLEDLFMENGLGMGFLHEYGSVYSSGSLSECVVLIIFFLVFEYEFFSFPMPFKSTHIHRGKYQQCWRIVYFVLLITLLLIYTYGIYLPFPDCLISLC